MHILTDQKPYYFFEVKIGGSLHRLKYPVIAQLKYDGEPCLAHIKDGACTLYSHPKVGKIRRHCSITDEIYAAGFDNDTILLGELHYGDGNNIYQFLMHKASNNLKLAVFDIIKNGGKDTFKIPLIERLGMLKPISGLKNVHIADGLPCFNSSQLDNFYHESITKGYEGIVAKSYSGTLPKEGYLKDCTQIIYDTVSYLPIIGFSKNKNRSSLLLGYVGDDNKVHPLSQCKVIFTHNESDQLTKFLNNFVTGETEANYLIKPYIMAEVKHYGILRLGNKKIHSLRAPELIKLLPNMSIENIRL